LTENVPPECFFCVNVNLWSSNHSEDEMGGFVARMEEMRNV